MIHLFAGLRWSGGLALALSAALTGSAAFASGKPVLLPQAVGERADYLFSGDSESPHGTSHQSWTFSLVRSEHGFDLMLSALNAQPSRFGASLQKDGTLAIRADESAPALYVLRRYNEVAGLLAGAPDALNAGDSWKTQLDVPLPQGGSARVPVSVSVAAASDGLSLVAEGETRIAIVPPADPGPMPVTGVFSGSPANAPGGNPGGTNGAPAGGPGALGGPPAGTGLSGAYQTGSAAPAGTGRGGSAQQSLIAVHATARFVGNKFATADGTIRVVADAAESPASLSSWTLSGR